MSSEASPSYSTAIHDHERRFDRGAWLTLAVGLGLIALTLAHLLWSFGVPTDGWLTEQVSHETGSTYRFMINQSGRPSPIHENDILLAVNGRGPETFIPNFGPNVGPGESLVYTLERDGQIVEVAVPPVTRKVSSILQVNAYRWRQNPLTILSPVIIFLIGAFVFLMRPGNAGSRYLFLIGAFFFCTLWGFADVTLLRGLASPLQLWVSGWLGGFWAYGLFPWLILLVLAFPHPIDPLRRFPRLTPALAYGIPFAIIFAASIPYLFNRDLVDIARVNSVTAWVVVAVMLVFLATLIVTLVYRFLTTRDRVARAQLRWFALGMVLGIGGLAVVATIGILLTLLDVTGYAPLLVGSIGFSLVIFLPLCLGIAILRYRLFDIDIIIRKTTSYAIITGLLALVYFGSIVVLQRLLAPITGESDIAVVLSTLLIAALFLPLRRRVQDAIDRRFFRKKYDAEKVLQQFAATARDETDLDALTAELLRVIRETMQPEHISIWLKPTDRQRMTSDE